MYSWDNAQVVLVGNKSDLDDERLISYERGRRLADQLGKNKIRLLSILDKEIKKDNQRFTKRETDKRINQLLAMI